MRRNRLRLVLVLVAPVAVLSLAFPMLQGLDRGDGPVPALPLRLGPWEGTDVPLTARTLELLGTDRVLQRIYRSENGDEVLVCVVAARGGERAIHPPEVCYRGWGFEITGRSFVEVTEGGAEPFRAQSLDLVRNERRRVCLYWYDGVGGPQTGFLARQIQGLLAGLRGESSDWALVRLSAAWESTEDRAAVVTAVRDLAARVRPALRLQGPPR